MIVILVSKRGAFEFTRALRSEFARFPTTKGETGEHPRHRREAAIPANHAWRIRGTTPAQRLCRNQWTRLPGEPKWAKA